MPEFNPNTLYYGDNLQVLRDFPAECVDLIYLDPPFNSNRNYNVLFKESAGGDSEAQIQAFEDTWHWGKESTTTWDVYEDVVSKQDDVGKILQAFVSALGHNDVTAYLTMMAPRLVELRRVLKPTGSIYLHCDPTASHYLKVLMDAVFGPVNFRSEIAWKRTNVHSDSKSWSAVSDRLLYYVKSTRQRFIWNPAYGPHGDAYLNTKYRHDDSDGRGPYRLDNMTSPNPRPNMMYEWKGHASPSLGWRYEKLTMERLDREGRIWYPDSKSKRPQFKRYLTDSKGLLLTNVWADIDPINSQASERLGYPTQKPEALLERIISASSNEGDIVLDPFCGCGTAVAAAHKLGRKWIGIDITYLAVDLMKNRLLTAFADDFPEGIEVDGEPADEAAALALAEKDKYQFQFWSVAKLGGTSRGGENRKGADQGVDGVLAFPEIDPEKSGKAAIDWRQVIISVKGGTTGPTHVRDLLGTVENEKAAMGVLVTVRQPTKAMQDAAASAGVYRSSYDKKSYPKIQIITAGDIIHGKSIDMPPRAGIEQYTRAPRAKRGSQTKLEM